MNLADFYDRYIRLYDENYLYKNMGEVYIMFLISVPLSLLLFFLFSKKRHKTLVDLGEHKWLVKK